MVDDVIKCGKAIIESDKRCIIMGCRSFDKNAETKVPSKSKFGNILTRSLLKVLCGVSVSDTQTGLRGFSKEVLSEFVDIPGERYEYELNVLLSTKEKDIKIVERPIKTVYINNNKQSHFNPIKDSLRIYAIFLKFIIVSLSSFLIDIGLFALFSFIIPGAWQIILATVIARVLSSIYNYLLNKNSVFKGGKDAKFTVIKYYALVVFIMIASALSVNAIVKYLWSNKIVVKIIVDALLFLFSFWIQRDFVFAKHKRKEVK